MNNYPYGGYGGGYFYKRPQRRRVPIKSLPRRARLLEKTLLRSARRWDDYAERVRTEVLPWEESKKTQEWRLILQNGLLLKGLRKLPNRVPERKERLAKNNDNPLVLSKMPLYPGSQGRRLREDSFGE